jgi:hypothetical protein
MPEGKFLKDAREGNLLRHDMEEHPIPSRVESLSAGPGWRLLPEFHHDCRNQHSSPLREPGLRPLRPGFSYNDRVTKGDLTDGDYDLDLAYSFCRRLPWPDSLVGLDDFLTSTIAIE